MDRLGDPLAPTAEIPLLEGPRLDMMKVLKKKGSHYEVVRCFPKIIQHLQSLPIEIDCKKTIQYMAAVEDEDPMAWLLLHAIPRLMFESLVLGTVAFDFSKDPTRCPTTYKTQEMGVYVISVCVIDRGGKWLTAQELGLLIDNAKRYCDGHER